MPDNQLKKIAVTDVCLGMYVHEICGSWMDHPFWNKQFKLTSKDDLKRLKSANVRSIWIDTSRGADIETESAAVSVTTPETIAAEGEAALLETVTDGSVNVRQVSMAQEIDRAADICRSAKVAVKDMFNDARMGKAVDTDALQPMVDEISQSVMRNAGALISLARLKTADDYTYMHSVAVCGLMTALSRTLGFDEETTRDAAMAGLLHDIGKVHMPLNILNKPQKLTEQEFAQVKDHPRAGYEMLVATKSVTEPVLDVCLHHHEKIDGSGYPEGLDDTTLTAMARMGAVCDVYDAITSERSYKTGWDPATAIRKMQSWREGHFDEHIFQAFVRTIGIYPVGSLVRLENGLLGVVTDVSSESLLTPTVKTFFCTRRNAAVQIEQFETTNTGERKITKWESPDDWQFPHLQRLWMDAAH